ncbi:amidohydrolase 2 [Caballeronia udeis]|uniref:Amidohydrolase 2 n=1 Tax=Caballeronia udeis TaxID=1232866 RepID=A0A158I571_9BURK|nr:amidohydrolase family protein [Caballeronia udeis]SAL51503.1 amidohydrolase 2 [Caballeronia udeis]
MPSVREVSIPAFTLPPGACDCHMHVFGEPLAYPLSTFRSYSVGTASVEEHLTLQQRLGLQRTVLVQASGYHTDNRCMLDALATLGAAARGVAVVDDDISMDELCRLDAAGVRGVRINLVSVGSFTPQQIWANVERLAKLLAELGWHMQFFVPPSQLPELSGLLRTLPVPSVIDHMGLPVQAAGPGQKGFDVLLRLLGEGRCWVKLSGADRITRGQPDMSSAGVFARALVDVNPDNLVWGSDWPHIGWHSSEVHDSDTILPFRFVDEGKLLDLLSEWVPDATVRNKILAHNPARLYRF